MRLLAAGLGFGLIAFFCVLVAYPAIHVGLREDEGYMLLTLKSFLAHGSLYDKVYSQYGPFDVEFWGGIYSLFGMPVNQDVGRDVTLVAWVLTSLVAGVVAMRLTRSVVLGFGAQLCVFSALSIATHEPMHPGGLICLLLVGVALVATCFGERRAVWPAAAIGALLAALVLTKVNVGGFALISVALVCTCIYPALSARRFLRLALEVLFVAVPLLLVATKADQDWARAFGVHVAVAALAVVIVLRTRSPEPRENEELAWIVTAFLVLAAAICLATVGSGTSIGGLFDGVVTQPLHQGDAFSLALRLPGRTWLLDAVGLGGAIGYWWLRRRRPELGPRWSLTIGAISVAIGVELALSVTGRALPATYDGEFWLPMELLAFAWVALIPAPGQADRPTTFARLLLPVLAVLQPLHAFPVAGSQIYWGTFLLVPVAAICVADGTRRVRDALRAEGVQLRGAALAGGAAALVLAVLLVDATIRLPLRQARSEYDAAMPLKLPGSARVRLPESEVMLYRTLSAELASRCPQFLTEPGMDAYYFWTDQEPPTGMNATAWSTLFSDAQQRQVIDETRPIEGLCVLRNIPIAETWTGGVPPRGPLVRYIRRDFRRVATWGPFELLKREGRG